MTNKFSITVFLVLGFYMAACQSKLKDETSNQGVQSKEIQFKTSDNITVFGDLYTNGKDKTTILLFHQGGSNARGEYGPIIPQLLDLGFNVLAIDQRNGGQVYGKYNRTVAQFNNLEYSYCEAYLDLSHALDYLIMSGYVGKKVLWGSSYSATLAIQLASKRSESIHGLLAFSPASGGPMKACLPSKYFEKIKTPFLLLRPAKEMEIESVKAQYDLALSFKHSVHIAANGVHGSSMLIADRTENPVDQTWKVVIDFLHGI